jgi:SAM-dependent methyltransferase
MAHLQQQEFCNRMRIKYPLYFENSNVLDIGSLDINGNNRYLFKNATYTGVDLAEGNNVDIISPCHLLHAPDGFYDFIISTEVFEHDMYWRESIKNIIRMLKPNGAFMFTCASTGRAEHGTPRSDNSYSAPLLLQMNKEWQNYYNNLEEHDIRSVDGFEDAFSFYIFEHNPNPGDLYFFGVKRG